MLNNGNKLILQYEIISQTVYVLFICAEESEKRELKEYNIIGYVPDIWFNVLLRKLLYGIYVLNYNYNGWIKIEITKLMSQAMW